jgi:hypothetical protein
MELKRHLEQATTMPHRNRKAILLSGAALACVVAVEQAQAALLIRNAPSQNVSCANGVCSATAEHAVLNTTQLANMLASSNVKVRSTALAKDIVAMSALSWTSAHRLTLDSRRSITIDNPVTVAGPGALTLTTNNGGSGGELSFAADGHVKFWDLSSSLIIDGASYTLIGNIATLASDIAADPSGHYALANYYDATPDGTYTSSPIATVFTGNFEGLGNTISHLKIIDITSGDYIGLFTQLGNFFSGVSGTIDNLSMKGVSVSGVQFARAGGIVGENQGVLSGDRVFSGTIKIQSGPIKIQNGGAVGGLAGFGLVAAIMNSYSSATVSGGRNALVGGLTGFAGANTISNSYASGAVFGTNSAAAGGLVGETEDTTITMSYATGAVEGGNRAKLGGLIGETGGGGDNISNSYARGAVSGGLKAKVGGLIGVNESGATVSASYSTGAVTAEADSFIGGFAGEDLGTGSFSDCYWDTTTSGIANPSQGAGNISNDPGLAGLTTAQLQSGLPAGFDPAIWAEDANINGGLPYLIANPPR